jgi:TonB family protein
MSVREVGGRAGWNGAALVLSAALAFGAAACRRQAAPPPPVVVDAAPDRPLGPPARDAAAGHPADASPDAAGPARGHGPRAAPAPRAPADGFNVSGSLGKADAETVLRGARDKLAACYEKGRAANAGLEGRVAFRLSIDNRGRVPMAEVVSSTLGSGDPETCMVEALRDLKFPPSPTGGESTLTFPMTFGR